jgi:hypothetical protein
MTAQKLQIRGTEMNKLQFSEIDYLLEEKGINVNEAFELMADEKEYVYVSNGFVNGLKKEENEQGEWHHFFKKDIDGNFEAGKLKFN